MDNKNKSIHIINDPIHSVMTFSNGQKEIVKKIIDDPIFQRLRRIKQLGCGDLVFPGAVHTRFNHMLGACCLAVRVGSYLKNLSQNENCEENSDNFINEIMVAGLLHDVGHGPFSHAFEKIYADRIDKIKNAKIKHDDDWLRKFLEYFKTISLPNLNFPEVENILLKKLPNNKRFKSDIISSQLDVDRMDYLLRDSHFCGVPYGNIDLEWLLSCMRICDVNNERRLSLSKKGIGALEHYINARRLMTKYIYYHGKKNASEYYIRVFLEKLCEFTNDKKIKDLPLMKFLKSYSEYISKVEQNSNSVADMKIEFINSSFDLYKILTDDDIWTIMSYFSSQNINNICYQISKRLLTRNLPYSYLLSKVRINKADEIVNSLKNKLNKDEKWQIYIDRLDLTSYEDDNDEPIYMIDDDCVIDILQESSLLNLLSNRTESRIFLYVDKLLDKKIFKELIAELNKSYCFESPVKYKEEDEKNPIAHTINI